ncbi:MAG: GIDE domain-containing protein, partial [Phycisphaeraceae bacterium]|nr:GIDE domain-containing protein [Phycisphaeraceae bacterium]
MEEAFPYIVMAVAFGGTVACLFFGFRFLRRKRLIENVPTSKTKGVFIGLNEVKGKAETDAPLTSHLAEVACLWYRYVVEEEWKRTETDSDGKTKTKSGWKTVAEEDQRVPFTLTDDTGSIEVFPQNAQMQGDKVFRETCRRSDSLYYDK